MQCVHSGIPMDQSIRCKFTYLETVQRSSNTLCCGHCCGICEDSPVDKNYDAHIQTEAVNLDISSSGNRCSRGKFTINRLRCLDYSQLIDVPRQRGTYVVIRIAPIFSQFRCWLVGVWRIKAFSSPGRRWESAIKTWWLGSNTFSGGTTISVGNASTFWICSSSGGSSLPSSSSASSTCICDFSEYRRRDAGRAPKTPVARRPGPEAPMAARRPSLRAAARRVSGWTRPSPGSTYTTIKHPSSSTAGSEPWTSRHASIPWVAAAVFGVLTFWVVCPRPTPPPCLVKRHGSRRLSQACMSIDWNVYTCMYDITGLTTLA